MDFKDILGKLDQLNEAEMTSRKVAGKAYGGAAQHDDEDDEEGEKKAAPAEKRGRGRPRKAGGEAQTKAGYGGAAELQRYIVGSVPKKSKELEKLGKTKHKLSDKEPEKKKVKESLKDWIAELDQLMEAEQLTIQPASQKTQVIKQGNKVLGSVENPQLASTIKQAISKGEMSLAGSELGEADYSAKAARAGKDIGKPGKQFDKIAKSAAERYGSAKKGKKVAGAVLAKLRKTNEADMPPNDSLSSPLTLESTQGVAEGSNNLLNLLRKYRRNEDNNLHSENVVLLAQHFGTPNELQMAKQALAYRNEQGGFDYSDPKANNYIRFQQEINKKYYPLLKRQGVAEGKKPDFLDLDKDGNKKESMKKAAADKKKDSESVSEGKSTVKHDDKAEKAGKKVAKDIEYDEKVKDKIHGKKRHSEDEKAEKAGKKVAKDIEYDEKKKTVKEGMDQRMKAAHHRGKAHALAKEGYNCRYDEGSEEARMYHEGYKMGLDECYGIMPMRGVVVGEDDMGEGLVGGLAGAGLGAAVGGLPGAALGYSAGSAIGDDMAEGALGATVGGVAGGVLGKSPTAAILGANLGSDIQDRFTKEESEQDVVDDMASFGALDEDDMEEGNAFTAALAKTPKGEKFSVGGKTFTDKSSYDSKVSETAKAFEGWDKQLNDLLTEGEQVDEGMSISVSKGQMGAPDSVSVTASDADADKLMALVKQMGILGGEEQASDYGVKHADQDAVHQHGDLTVVDDHDGMMALIKKVAGPGMEQGSEDYADEMSHDHDETCEGCGMPESACGCHESEEMVDEEESEDQMEFEVSEDNAPDSDEAETSADEDAEAKEDAALAGADSKDEEEVNESEDDEEHDGLEESFANSADDTFEADMDFMTKVISGGLNKQKSTGQTTVPVIPGQKDRMGVDGMHEGAESIMDWKKLAGIK